MGSKMHQISIQNSCQQRCSKNNFMLNCFVDVLTIVAASLSSILCQQNSHFQEMHFCSGTARRDHYHHQYHHQNHHHHRAGACCVVTRACCVVTGVAGAKSCTKTKPTQNKPKVQRGYKSPRNKLQFGAPSWVARRSRQKQHPRANPAPISLTRCNA